MTEWEHDMCLCKGVGYLVHQAEPAAHVGQGLGAGEGKDVVHEGGGWLDPCVGNAEAKEVHLSGAELELGGVKYAAPHVAALQELTNPLEVVLNRVIPND